MPGIEIRTRGQVFDKRSRVKQAGKLLLDCKLPPGMLACYRLEVWSCEYLAQVPEAVRQAMTCGDERHAVPYRHAVSLRLYSPVAARLLPTGRESQDMECLAISGLIVAEFP